MIDLGALTDRPGWMRRAACAGMAKEAGDALFFPGRGESTRNAKAVCMTCPVRRACLEYALDNREQFGIWGGMSGRERRAERRRRIAAAA